MALIEIKNLTKTFGKIKALDNVSLALEKGNIVGLLGPNGSGKTTLIKSANGLLCPDSGEIVIAGMAPGKDTKAITSYLPDRTSLPEKMTAKELIKLYEDFFNDFNAEAAEKMMAELGIDMSQKYKALSKGTKEKVQLILVMSRNAKVYWLDEPIGGVDPATRDYIIKTIITNYNEDAVVIISTHLIADVESILDDVVFIKDGQIVLHEQADVVREKNGKSVDGVFREVFKC
ncbi:MAG: ABC transporter ATP-binding protein [Bacillota bacterium]|nr:ABC transporter ATP-binding protein [Bacillota bacterium]